MFNLCSVVQIHVRTAHFLDQPKVRSKSKCRQISKSSSAANRHPANGRCLMNECRLTNFFSRETQVSREKEWRWNKVLTRLIESWAKSMETDFKMS